LAEKERVKQKLKDERVTALTLGFRGTTAPKDIDSDAIEKKKAKIRSQITAEYISPSLSPLLFSLTYAFDRSLDMALKHEDIANGFRDFVAKEMASENLDFLLEVFIPFDS